MKHHSMQQEAKLLVINPPMLTVSFITVGYPLLGYRKGSLIELSFKESLIDKSNLLEKGLIPN